MPRVRQLHQAGDDDMFFPASLEQQTMIKNAIARGNAYNDQMISAGIAWANSLLIATIAYKYLGANLTDFTIVKQWTFEKSKEAAKPYVATFLNNYSHVFDSEAKFWQCFDQFRKIAIMLESTIHTRPAEKININFNRRLVKFLGTKDQYIIDRFRNLSIYAIKTGHFQLELNLAISLALIGPAVNGYIFLPIQKFLLHKIYGLRFLLDKPHHALTDIQADNLLAQLKKENEVKKTLAHYVNILDRSITLMTISYYFYKWLETNEWPDPGLIIFMYVNCSKIILDLGKSQWKIHQQKLLAQKIEIATRVIGDLFTPFGLYKITKKKTFTDCYAIFRASIVSYLSVAMVNQIVKDVLLKHGVPIIGYSKTGFTCRLIPDMHQDEVNDIKLQIINILARWSNIKLLNQQLMRFFRDRYFIQEIESVKNLPTATTIINFPLGDVAFDRLVQHFPSCRIVRVESSVVIVGHTPSEQIISYGMERENAPESTTESDSTYSADSDAYTSRNRFRKIKAKSILFFDPGSESLKPANEPEPIKINRWPSGIYNSSLGNLNKIKPVNSNLGSFFVLFALPREFFPSENAYTKVKTKIEEGRFATNEQGSQGLQFRPGVARDITQQGEPWFTYFLRYKLLGMLGDARFYAKKELTTDGERLGVFCGGNWSSH
jgi:hypothetical protein